MSVHPTAVIEPGARMADDVRVEAHALIGAEVELGPGVQVGPGAVVTGRTTIGARTRIFAHACLGAEPQIVGVDPGEATTLEIGADNVLREHVTVHRGSTEGGGVTRIGDRNYIMNSSHVAHDCRVGSDCVIASFSGLAGHVRVEDHVVLGAYTGVHQHARIGESAMTASGSKVSKDVPPFSMVAGDRARLIGLNGVGLRRRGFEPSELRAIKRAFHALLPSERAASGASLEVALASLEADPSPRVRQLVEFVRASERGVCR